MVLRAAFPGKFFLPPDSMGAVDHSKRVRQHLFTKGRPGDLRADDLCEEWDVADNSLH
jgi:hypothetical protein